MNQGIYVGGIYPDGGVYNVSQQGVVIGGKNYKTKKIGNLIWTTENLDAATANSVPRTAHPEFGRYYPYEDLSSVKSLIDGGWRIPNKNDFTDLLNAANLNVRDLQSVGYSLWPNATDAKKFSAVPNRIDTSSESQLDRSILWTSQLSSDHGRFATLLLENSSNFFDYGQDNSLKCCLRLCKNAKRKNLFKKSTSSLLAGYCGTVGTNFIIDANNGSQRSLVIPITDEMKGKSLRFSCDNGDAVANRWICGQVNEIPSSGRTTYGNENILFISSLKQVDKRSFTDTIHDVGNYNYIVFFFDSGLPDTSRFVDSLMITADGDYYPYVSGG